MGNGVDWSAVVPEDRPVDMLGLRYHPRRGPDVDGAPRWSVFRNGAFAPIGYIEGHRCPDLDGEPRLVIFDKAGRRIAADKPKRAFERCLGCLPNLDNAINCLRVEYDHPQTPLG